MSHFAVMVIGENPEAQLAPYHEFECTGVDDQYIQEIDVTSEVLAELDEKISVKQGTTQRCRSDDAEAELISRRELAERDNEDPLLAMLGDRNLAEHAIYVLAEREVDAVHAVDGIEEMNFAVSPERALERAQDEIDRSDRHKFGYAILTGGTRVGGRLHGMQLVKAIRRTNPQARWDWYQLGGRWTGFFKLKAGYDGAVGSPGLQTERARDGYADAARKGAIDFRAMQEEAARNAHERYHKFFALLGDLPRPETFEALRARHGEDIKAAREEYWAQPGILRVTQDPEFIALDDIVSEFSCEEDAYVQHARDAATAPFAMVVNGEWYEKGRMGWFGLVTGERGVERWQQEVARRLDALSDDTLLSVFDCHI